MITAILTGSEIRVGDTVVVSWTCPDSGKEVRKGVLVSNENPAFKTLLRMTGGTTYLFNVGDAVCEFKITHITSYDP